MSGPAILSASLRITRSTLTVEADFELTAPWTCLFGPSGSGKSTLLRVIAGLDQPDTGRIVLGASQRPGATDPQVLFDHEDKWTLPAHQRSIRISPQGGWLFPGTVLSNITYGLPWKDQENAANVILERMRLTRLQEARVETLSGGERQRVAVARAVSAALYGRQPARLLLLDEPFTGMDVALRDELVSTLQSWLGEMHLPVLSVTHDIGEVFLLAAEVIRIAEGKVIAQGPARDVLAREREQLLGLLD